MSTILLISAGLALCLGAWVAHTLRHNARLLRAVEQFYERDQKSRDALLLELHHLFDRPASGWRPVLSRYGIEVATTFTSQSLAGGRGVRTYRTVSYLREDEITVDRMLALLDGGFLREEVWFKGDFKGGACLDTLSCPAGQSAWIAQYLSDVKPLRMREFIYLLFRRDLAPDEFCRVDLWQGQKPVRQACIAYRSTSRASAASGRVRAIQYPSLDRISLHADGTIRWEHIMAFHVAGILPLWLNNALTGPAAEVLFQEAANMRKHARQTREAIAARVA